MSCWKGLYPMQSWQRQKEKVVGDAQQEDVRECATIMGGKTQWESFLTKCLLVSSLVHP